MKNTKSRKAHKTSHKSAKSKSAMAAGINTIADMQKNLIKTARANTTKSFNKALAAIEVL